MCACACGAQAKSAGVDPDHDPSEEKPKKAATKAKEPTRTTAGRSAKLASAMEFGVVQAADEDSGPTDNKPAGPSAPTDVFAVKMLALLLKLVALPSGGDAVVRTQLRKSCRHPIVSLLSLVWRASPKVRVLAAKALCAVLPSVAHNPEELSALDEAVCGLAASFLAPVPPSSHLPGGALCRFLLYCLGRTVATPLLACLSLNKAACIRKTEEVERVFYTLCESGHSGQYGPQVWHTLKETLADVAAGGSALSHALQTEVVAAYQVR